MSQLLRFTFALILCLVSIISVPVVSLADAASAPSLAETAPAPADSAEIPADKIEQFAGAYLKVLHLLSDREPELPAAETSAEALKVQQSIEAEAVALITDSGLTMPEYMQILGLASQDESFRDKVLSRMDESIEE